MMSRLSRRSLLGAAAGLACAEPRDPLKGVVVVMVLTPPPTWLNEKGLVNVPINRVDSGGCQTTGQGERRGARKTCGGISNRE